MMGRANNRHHCRRTDLAGFNLIETDTCRPSLKVIKNVTILLLLLLLFGHVSDSNWKASCVVKIQPALKERRRRVGLIKNH